MTKSRSKRAVASKGGAVINSKKKRAVAGKEVTSSELEGLQKCSENMLFEGICEGCGNKFEGKADAKRAGNNRSKHHICGREQLQKRAVMRFNLSSESSDDETKRVYEEFSHKGEGELKTERDVENDEERRLELNWGIVMRLLARWGREYEENEALREAAKKVKGRKGRRRGSKPKGRDLRNTKNVHFNSKHDDEEEKGSTEVFTDVVGYRTRGLLKDWSRGERVALPIQMFKCNICEKLFLRIDDLRKKHSRNHTSQPKAKRPREEILAERNIEQSKTKVSREVVLEGPALKRIRLAVAEASKGVKLDVTHENYTHIRAIKKEAVAEMVQDMEKESEAKKSEDSNAQNILALENLLIELTEVKKEDDETEENEDEADNTISIAV